MSEIFKKIPLIMTELGAIGKDSTNKMQGWAYRGVEDVYNALHPIMAKHGVFTVPEVVEVSQQERKNNRGGTLTFSIVKIKYKVFASDGSFIEAVINGEAMDSSDKSIGKAMSYAHKYLFFQLFTIPTRELIQDPDEQALNEGEKLMPASQQPPRQQPPRQQPPKATSNNKDISENHNINQSIIAEMMKLNRDQIQVTYKHFGTDKDGICSQSFERASEILGFLETKKYLKIK